LIPPRANGAAYQIAETYAWRGEPTRRSNGSIAPMPQRDAGMAYIKSTRSSSRCAAIRATRRS
jgi:hypothetical protein